MILTLLVFLVSAAVWVSVLWLVFLPRLSNWPDVAVAAAHLLPPIVIAWLGVLVRQRVQRRRANEAHAREESAQVERKAAREAALKKHEEEMRQRRFACDCRIVAFSRLGLVSPGPVPDPDRLNVGIRPMLFEPDDSPREGGLLDGLKPAIEDALFTVYSACRASLAFPIYVLPPADIPGEEVLTHLRAVQSMLAGDLAPEMDRVRTPVLFLPAADSIPGSILSLFESSPDLPGAVILAFDSPHSRMPVQGNAFDDEPEPSAVVREQYSGKPSEAVVALLVTNTELPSMLTAMCSTSASGEADSMTPFWAKALHADGWLEALSRADVDIRTELLDLPVLGRVHRAVVRHSGTARSGALELTRVMQDALEQAQINAGLIDPSFGHDESNVDGSRPIEAAPAAPHCGALVHNAGSVEVAGKRLAALGSALYYYNVDLSPVDPDVAFNVVTRIGDTGRASGLTLLALGLVYAARDVAPVLCADYMEGNAVAASIITPAGFGSKHQHL